MEVSFVWVLGVSLRSRVRTLSISAGYHASPASIRKGVDTRVSMLISEVLVSEVNF